MKRRMIATLALAAMALPVQAGAQDARPVLNHAAAAKMQDACIGWAAERKLEMAIAVYDDAARLIAFAHMDGARTGSNTLARDKAKSAAGFRIATADMAKMNVSSVPGIVGAGGGVPFTAGDGTPLGAMGVSGGTAQEDIDCAKAGIAAAGLKPVGGQ